MTSNLDYIIDPVDRDLLKKELNKDTFVRVTNKGHNELYIIDHHDSPHTMREVGRLREVTFASAGGGTGKEVDIDEYDTSDNCYKQLIVWSPEDEQITGGYRFIDCSTIMDTSPLQLSTGHYFNFSEKFLSEYLPYTIELGRSWVQPLYQPSVNPRKGIFALDNLWDGLGAITIDYPHIKHYFGKVTMYPDYNSEARDAVLSFMKHFFDDSDRLVVPKQPLEIKSDLREFMSSIQDDEFKPALKKLSKFVQDRGEHIPPLINNYMQLSPTMKSFGTALNKDFGDVEETGILVTIADIYDEKKSRHVDTYTPER